MIDIEALFDTIDRNGELIAGISGAERRHFSAPDSDVLLDSFDGTCRCLFRRGNSAAVTELLFPGNYRVSSSAVGGWLIIPQTEKQASYWVPQLPALRLLDGHGRILWEEPCDIRSFEADSDGVRVGLGTRTNLALDLMVWQLGPSASDVRPQLEEVDGTEQQPTFLWGSHGTYRIPADLYRHLIHGSVFDLRFSWPHKRRAYSENEAHALHLALRNREIETGKNLYRYLRDQVVLSVLARQDADGTWRQGIWTANMECHFRLHCSAMHMLMDCYSERPDETILDALSKAAAFIAAQATKVMGETWFLHDSLEQNEEQVKDILPGWHHCSNTAKEPSNTLVLNTHVDTLIALARFRELTGSDRHDADLESARRVLHRLLKLKPAEHLYRPFFRAIYLTLLPTERARALPFPIRALKRIARNHLTALLPSLRCRFPRLVMPDGYIDRSLSEKGGLSHQYHAINLMDLVRYRQRFPEDRWLGEIITNALKFVNKWHLIEFWSEHPAANYATGFWIEALYRLCLQDSAWSLRERLALALLSAADNGVGIPPSLRGRNCEALHPSDQMPCPKTVDDQLWVVNLGTREHWEILIVNTSTQARSAELHGETPVQMSWTPSWTVDQPSLVPTPLPPQSWVLITHA